MSVITKFCQRPTMSFAKLVATNPFRPPNHTRRSATMSSTTNSQKPFRWQKLDHRKELIFSDPLIRRDEQLLDILKKAVSGKISNPNKRSTLKIAPSLYSRYRGTGFPLTRINNSPFPRWRDISSWLKVQVGLFVLAEGKFVHFQMGLHDGLMEELKADGVDMKTYLRDRIARSARPIFGFVPYYFFLFEDRDKTGAFNVPAHAHGTIEVPLLELPKTQTGKTRARYRKIELLEGTDAAELEYGKELIREALIKAAGLATYPKVWNKKSQARKVWIKDPDNPIFNNNWVTYAFKNVRFDSALLDENRLVFSRDFKTEVTNFWKLITKGEAALVYWLARGRTR